MSSKGYQFMSLSGMNVLDKSSTELEALTQTILKNQIHGISFSPYTEGQGPGTPITEEQIGQRLDVISDSVQWIRSFSCTEGNELIPKIAKQRGLKTLVGAWLNDDLENNEKEINNLIATAKAGYVDIVAVGNEVLLREDLTEEQLINYIRRVKEALPDFEVGYVDAYYEFEVHPKVTEQCDVILANCYPFWEGCALEYSILYMKDMYRRAVRAGNGKKVIITETGWPNEGPKEWGAEPSYINAMKYFIGTYQWAEEDDIDVFYFSSFDETWKVEDEGGVGAHWGLWDKDGQFKYG
ncbi:glycosyl hydrolase family 17 protein [Glaciecola sp. SC05]|uniref:glycoside hydrolase family 17 protein n=1 Tax=Glaciecola sp. SC05 TaxID=1987355 RepID=UPI003527B378